VKALVNARKNYLVNLHSGRPDEDSSDSLDRTAKAGEPVKDRARTVGTGR
jgi:hypothetical protein